MENQSESHQVIGHVKQDIKLGDIIHITVNSDDTWESPEIEFNVQEN